MAKGVSDLNLTILQETDWDPMEVLKTNEGKITDENFKPIKGDEEEEEEDEEENPKTTKGEKPKPSSTKSQANGKPDLTKIDLTDDQIEAGLKTTKGKNTTSTSQEDEEEEEEENSEKKTNPKNPKNKSQGIEVADSVFAAHYNAMVKSGEWDEVEGFDGTRESYVKARDYNNQLAAENIFDEFISDAFEKNPEGKALGKQLLSHLARGGRIADFQVAYGPAQLDFEALDSDKDEEAESAAIEILSSYYNSIGWKKPQIDNKLAQLKKTGGTVDEAKIVRDPFKEAIAARQSKIETTTKEQSERVKQHQKKVNTALNNFLTKGFQIGSVEIGKNKKSQQEYQDYLFSPNEQNETQFQADMKEAWQSPEFIMFMAGVVKEKLYKNPEAFGNKKVIQQEAKDEIEEILSSSLLNKNLKQHQASSSSSGEGGGKGSKGSKYEWNLDDAIPIHIPG